MENIVYIIAAVVIAGAVVLATVNSVNLIRTSEEDNSIKISSDMLAGKIVEIWENSGLGERDTEQVLNIISNSTITKETLVKDIIRMNKEEKLPEDKIQMNSPIEPNSVIKIKVKNSMIIIESGELKVTTTGNSQSTETTQQSSATSTTSQQTTTTITTSTTTSSTIPEYRQFYENKENYLEFCNSAEGLAYGDDDNDQRCIWAWLYQNNHNDLANQNFDHMFDRNTGTWNGEELDETWWYSFTSYSPSQVMSIYSRYEDQLTVENIDKLMTKSGEFLMGDRGKNPNQAYHLMVAEYLYAENIERYADYTCDEDPSKKWCVFSYNGNSYEYGNTYKMYDITRDFLLKKMELLAKMNSYSRASGELDSPNYSWSFINAFLTLYDGTSDPEMKKRAEMILDLLYLDMGVDCVLHGESVNCGGPIGREYTTTLKQGRFDQFPWEMYWLEATDFSTNKGITNNIYTSEYRLAPIIIDIIDLSDEEDNYIQYKTEHHNKGTSGDLLSSSTHTVSKYWGIGGYVAGANTIMINSDEGTPFMIWISDSEELENPGNHYAGTNRGTKLVAYRQSTVVDISNAVAHFIIGSHEFDTGQNQLTAIGDYGEDGFIIPQENDNWNYFMEGKTAVAIRARDNIAGAEVTTICEDCQFKSFDEFKNAERDLVGYCLESSYGYELCKDYTRGYGTDVAVDGETIYDYPFERIEMTDNKDNKVIDWNNNIMTLSKNGRICTYNFNTWEKSGDCTT